MLVAGRDGCTALHRGAPGPTGRDDGPTVTTARAQTDRQSRSDEQRTATEPAATQTRDSARRTHTGESHEEKRNTSDALGGGGGGDERRASTHDAGGSNSVCDRHLNNLSMYFSVV